MQVKIIVVAILYQLSKEFDECWECSLTWKICTILLQHTYTYINWMPLCSNIQKSWRETEHLKIKTDILICMISNSFFLKAIIKVTDVSNIYGKTVLNSQQVNKFLSILNNSSYIHMNPDIRLSIMFVSKILRKVSIRTYNIPSSSYLYIAYVRSPPILIWRIMQCKKH